MDYPNRGTLWTNKYKNTDTKPDMTGDIKTRTGGATAPSFAAYRGTIYQFKFGTVPGEFEVFNEFHIQHDWVPGTDLYVHSHWSTADAPTGTTDWMFDIICAKG